MLPAFEGLFREGVVRTNKSGDDDGLNGRVCEHVIMVSGRLYPWELPLELPAALRLQLGNHAHLRRGELIKVADEFRSPVPTANDTNSHRSHRASPFRCSPLA